MKKILILVASLWIFLGCSSLRVNSDYDPGYNFSALKTYAVAHYNRPGDDTLLNDRIIKALEENLQGRGYQKVFKEEAELLFVFHTNVEDKTRIDTDYQMMGYGRYGYGGHMVATTRTYNYTKGTLVVDAMNPKTQKIVWRGTATDVLSAKKSPEERSAYIKEVINETMKHFPPQGK